MKKTSRYLIIAVIIGTILVSFWSYQKYFKKKAPELLLFNVEKGSIQEVVRVRGDVVSQKDFDLEFPFSGVVESVFVKEGQQVSGGTALMKLETTAFELDIKKTQAQLAQAQAGLAIQEAKLAELKRGTRFEKIQVQEVKVTNAKTSVEDAKNNLINKLQDIYTKSDDSIRNKIDQLFDNPRSSNPKIKFIMVDSQLKSDIERQRISIEVILKSWKLSLDQLTIKSDKDLYILEAGKNLDEIKLFLDRIAFAVNGAVSYSGFPQATFDAWKSDVSTARTNINTAITNLSIMEEKLNIKESNLALIEQELVLKKAGATEEQLAAQEAQVKQAKANIQNYQAQVAIVQDKIKKSTLYAPEDSKIVKILFEKRELFSPGRVAINLETYGYKIQADISELEIGKIREINGNDVLIQLDAFPDIDLNGKIVSIESREVIKDGDKYYRTNISIGKQDFEVRSGMSADLIIFISSKNDVLKIPELTIFQKDNKKFVIVLDGELQKEVEVKTGISDGESIEITRGVNEGQIIVISAD